jgi:GT2 family glycosyltransferase
LVVFPFMPHSGVKWRGPSSWDAIDDDPSFILSFRLMRPRFLVIRLESAGGLVDPVLYLDTGKGFSEAETLALDCGRRVVCVIALHSLKEVRRIRLDPASRPLRFALDIKASGKPADVRRHLAQATKWRDRDLAVATKFCHLGEDPLWADLPGPPLTTRRFTNIADHYEKVLGLAALQSRPDTADVSPDASPLFSFVVPVYNTPPAYLDDLLLSFRIQHRSCAELILSDDGSKAKETTAYLDALSAESGVKIVRNRENRGIAAATNAGLAVARGTWVGLVDHDDALAPHSINVLAEAVAAHPGAQFFYTDEVVTDKSLRPVDYFFKPAYDPVLLSGINYINHLALYRRQRLLERGGLREGYDGSQDYDLLLRYLAGLGRHEIVHVPFPAYLWRRDGRSFTTSNLDIATQNARKALASHYAQDGVAVPVDPALSSDLHRVRFDATARPRPKVSVVIPNRDAYPLISRILDDLHRKTEYPDLEIIVIDNGSLDPRVLALYDDTRAKRPSTVVAIEPEPYNFARSINKGVRRASGDLVLLLNNDIEVIEPSWLDEMVSCFAYPDTGIVGARLLYPDRTLQHAGVIVGVEGLAGHWFNAKASDTPGPMGRLRVRQSFSAVTAACMLVSRPCLEATGRFDEDVFPIAYNDTDFCLRANAKGFRVVWTPFATLIHHESATRGSDESEENIARFRRDKLNLDKRHKTSEFEDRAYNPWYARTGPFPRPVLLDRLPKPRI